MGSLRRACFAVDQIFLILGVCTLLFYMESPLESLRDCRGSGQDFKLADQEILAQRFRSIFVHIVKCALKRERACAPAQASIQCLAEAEVNAVRMPHDCGGAGRSVPQHNPRFS